MSEKTYFEPASSIVSRFGTSAEVARILEIDKSTVCRWMMDKDKKGTGGKIPRKYWEPLLEAARQRRIKLAISELVSLNK